MAKAEKSFTVDASPELLDALDGKAQPQFSAVTHPENTQYWQLSKLRVHPDNPRIHADTFAGIHVLSSVRAGDMADSIQRIGDITRPLTICGDGCASKPGTILSGNRRFEGLKLLQSGMQLPKVLTERGIPVDVRHNLSAADEMNILNDHGDTVPLNPTECFRAMLGMQKRGYRPEEIVFRHPGLLAGYLGRQLPPLPTDADGRAKWYDKQRDTLNYGVLCWGIFPEKYLAAKVMAIQEEKEKLYTKENPAVYVPFKPTAKRTKDLYSAMRKDRANGQWHPENGGPEFNTLVAAYTAEDAPKSKIEISAPVIPAIAPPTGKDLDALRAAIGGGNPVADTLLAYAVTGKKTPEFHDTIARASYAQALVTVIERYPEFFKRVLPAPVFDALAQRNVNFVQESIKKWMEENPVK